ncbi:MAG: hypothetical protein ABFS45_24310 [Pseudomonadota bacterium]
MGPPVPPGESTGMNKELPGQCTKAYLPFNRRETNREKRFLLGTSPE